MTMDLKLEGSTRIEGTIDVPRIKTVDGVADIGFALIAWFLDPAKNCLGIIQVK